MTKRPDNLDSAVVVPPATVLVVGATHPGSVVLDKQTVWTDYGSGYGYVPLLLPFVVIWWLWFNSERRRGVSTSG